MNEDLSANTQAILLLTAPLLAGGKDASGERLTAREYKTLARHLRELGRQPADLLEEGAESLLRECSRLIETGRLKRLLGRGFLLAQAVERWRTRAIWVISRADPAYPRRLKTRLKEDAPAVLYGCGDASLLEQGGLAVVGSRAADEALLEFTRGVGRLVAGSQKVVVSGGARGIDQAAVAGALAAGGRAAAVLADSLERASTHRENRDALMKSRLVLVSPYDPAAGFNVGNAMQRNKYIYALADAGLVVSSDYAKGGTWAGATEQLEALRFVPVFVRSTGESGQGLDALRKRGALPWPNPVDAAGLARALRAEPATPLGTTSQAQLPLDGGGALVARDSSQEGSRPTEKPRAPEPASPTLGEELFAKVMEVLLRTLERPATEQEVSEALQISKVQAKLWLQRLVDEGRVEKAGRPARYSSRSSVTVE